jgi:GDP-L-fucose synthase
MGVILPPDAARGRTVRRAAVPQLPTMRAEFPWADVKVYVAGHNGLVGSAIVRALEAAGAGEIVGWRSSELDLRDREATHDAILEAKPDIVIDAAAKVGGIMANSTYPVEFLRDNLLIQTNVMDAAHAGDIDRLLFLGSSCIYPRHATQPIRESSLMTGPLEPTNQAYAMAKISGIYYIEAHRTQYGRHWISAMPTNLYGPFDNFDLQTSHVLPAFIHRFHEAKVTGAPSVTVWGTGAPRREFLHVDDLAQASLMLLQKYDSAETINVGLGDDMPIRELAETVAAVVGFEGEIEWDSSKPDGMPRKLLDTTRINELGWQPQIKLRDGVADTYAWYVENVA